MNRKEDWYERGLRQAAEVGPEGWVLWEKNSRERGYSDVRHYMECSLPDDYPSDYIDGLLDGAGLNGEG